MSLVLLVDNFAERLARIFARPQLALYRETI